MKHSVHVYERLRELYCNELARNSSGPVILTDEEEETIAVCGLLHDVCKANVYKKEPKNQKSYDPEKVKRAQKWQIKHDELGDFIWESVMSYKFEDQRPYGHGEKSVYIVSGFMKLSREEAFAIRFHMGTWQDGEKQNVGNAFNMFPLAVMMHLADMQATYFDEKDEKYAELLNALKGYFSLVIQPFVDEGGRDHIELPLIEVHWIGNSPVCFRKEAEHI